MWTCRASLLLRFTGRRQCVFYSSQRGLLRLPAQAPSVPVLRLGAGSSACVAPLESGKDSSVCLQAVVRMKADGQKHVSAAQLRKGLIYSHRCPHVRAPRGISVSRCCNHTCGLKQHVYDLTVLEVGNLNRVSRGRVTVLAGLVPPGGSGEGPVPLALAPALSSFLKASSGL